MKKNNILLGILWTVIPFGFLAIFIELTFAQEPPKINKDLIQIEIIKNDSNTITARIKKISDDKKQQNQPNLDKIIISGQKKSDKQVTNITWKEVTLKDVPNKKAVLGSGFESKVQTKTKLENGDSFKAKGNVDELNRAILELLAENTKNSSQNKTSSTNKSINSFESTGSSSTNTGRLSSFSSTKQNPSSITSTTVGETETTNKGCTPRVDYELNKVFIQEKTLVGGTETQSCSDSKTSFDLQKDYQSCPINVDTALRKTFYYFQYFYIDDKSSKQIVGNCQVDNAKTVNLTVSKLYDNCNDYVDTGTSKAYAQYQETYKDSDGKNIVLKDCSIDTAKSYSIVEDKQSCGIRHIFESNYSVQQSKFYYIKDGQKVAVQDCADTSNTYQHNTTSDTCNNQVQNNQVTLSTRKYITVSGARQFISECTPSGNVNVLSENCTSNPFTHDFDAKTSYRNKNYYYQDSSGQRFDIFSCVKSEESFSHQQDTSICTSSNDDVALKTTLYSKTFITVDGQKNYITSCSAVSPAVNYTEIGYQWNQEFNIANTSISAAGISSSTYLGSKQGQEVNTSRYNNGAGDWTQLINQFNISGYSTSNKCNGWSSLSYNGNQIDTAYSDMSSITYSNYVNDVSSAAMCISSCYWWSNQWYRCEDLRRECQSSQNTLYYQVCSDYRCSVAKLVQYPVYRRGDNTEYTSNAKILGTKYTCGNSGLNGTKILYNNPINMIAF